MARLTLHAEKGEGVAELTVFNRKTPGIGHLTKFGLSRTKVVRNREHILTFFVGLHIEKIAQGFRGCPGVHLIS